MASRSVRDSGGREPFNGAQAPRGNKMKDYSEYQDYGEYLEDAYEEWLDQQEKEYEQQSQKR